MLEPMGLTAAMAMEGWEPIHQDSSRGTPGKPLMVNQVPLVQTVLAVAAVAAVEEPRMSVMEFAVLIHMLAAQAVAAARVAAQDKLANMELEAALQ